MQQLLERLHRDRKQERILDVRRLAARASGCLAVFRLLGSSDALDEVEEALSELETVLDQLAENHPATHPRMPEESIARRRRMTDTFSPLSHPNWKEPR